MIVRQCDEDPYYVKHRYSVQAADGTTTWGQKIVKSLNYDIQNNAKNKFEYGLNDVKLDNLRYINQGLNYKGDNIFTPSYIDELNHKLAYLEVSSGIQIYVRFVEVTCTFTQQEGTKFAEKIFENSDISKTKGIYVLIVRNTDAAMEAEWKTYFAYGSDIPDNLKTSSENLLTINSDRKYSSFGTSLIQFYKIVPKKQKQYIYIIEKATSEERNRSEHTFLTKRILSKPTPEVKENQTGNAIRAIYYVLDTETGILELLDTDVVGAKELKEQYVADEGSYLAKIYAEKAAGWRLVYIDNKGDMYSDRPIIFDCKFTLEKTCMQQAIDAGFLTAGIVSVPFGNVAIVLDGLAVVYYINTGQTDMAIAYLAGYALGPAIGQTIKGIAIVTPKIVRFSQKLYVESRLVLQMEKGLTEQGVKTLLNRTVENGKVVEYLIPDNTYGNLFVKATDDEVLVGYIKTEQNKDILVVLANKKGSNSLTGKLTNASEEGIKRLADDVLRKTFIDANIYIKNGKYVEGITKIDLMGGKVSQLGDGFINIDIIAEKGIRGSVKDLSKFIRPNSIDEIVCTSPQADFLDECSKIMRSNSKIYINGTLKNKYFKNISKGKIEQLGFEVIEEQTTLNIRFQNQKFYLSDGITEMNKDLEPV